jgi:hypothetical protein
MLVFAPRVTKPEPPFRFEFPIEFYKSYLCLRHETAANYLKLGILVADAVVGSGENTRPLFRIDPVSVERHKERIRRYRTERYVRHHRLEVAA